MPKVTLFKNITTISEPHLLELSKVLGFIKDGRYKDQVESIRHGDPKLITDRKKELPCICFAGEFTTPVELTKEDGTTYTSCRTDRSLSKHSGFLPIDIDDIDNVDAYIQDRKQDHFIYALWKSPSGTGVHGLIRIGNGNQHRQHYNALLKRYPELDSTARNESRILFMSYDPDIHINERSSVFYDIAEDELTPSESKIVLSGSGYTDYRKIDIACKMVRLAPDGQKHNTLLKAANLLGGYMAVNKVEREVAEACLSHEISKRNIESPELAMNTIRDGLNYGSLRPIFETEQALRQAEEDIAAFQDELGFLSSNLDDFLYIEKFRNGLIPQGLTFGYHGWDEYLLLKEGEFYASLAHSHIGKSTVNIWLITISAILHKWNWMIYMGENSPAYVKMRIMEHYIGKKIKEMNGEEIKLAQYFVEQHFFFIDNHNLFTYKELIEKFERFLTKKSLKGVFIDPYNSLKSELTNVKSKYIYDYEAYSEMLTFTRRTGCTLFLSVHTTTAAQRERDKDGNQVMPHATFTEGGAALYNRADNFLTYHRKIKSTHEWMITEISVDKVRNRETGGKPTTNGDPLKIIMRKGLEFTDEGGYLPFDRYWLI